MASKAMKARLAARLVDTDADGAMVEGGTTDVSGLGGADESDVSETPVVETSEESPKAEKVEAAPAPKVDPEADARAARLKLFEEKLAETRERRQSARLAEQARAERKAAQEEREAARVERAKLAEISGKLRTGSFRESLVALGRDPAKAFEEMSREAIEASTPEAAARREKYEAEQRERDREAALEERFRPVLSELEQLRAERAQWAEAEHRSNIQQSYQHASADPAFKDLRIEYSDEDLLEYAHMYDKNPEAFYAAAHQYGVRLTSPGKGFSMHEVLQLLGAAQAAHHSGVQARRAAQRPPEPQSGTPTVNGTAPRRNAAVTGNDPAPGTSGAEDSSLSPREIMRQRARAEIRRA